MTHVVTAPLIAVSVAGEWHQLLAGAVVPSGVKSEDLNRLKSEGYIKTVEAPATDVVVPGVATAPAAKAPNRKGPGSGTEAWKTYAAGLGVDVSDAADRDAVIAALEAAGHPVE